MSKALSLDEARQRVLVGVVPLPRVECVALADAHGRFLAQPLVADEPWPATDRSAMDGFAVVVPAAGLEPGLQLPVVGESLAGRPFGRDLAVGEAIRIMTGAVVPAGCAVVPVEQTSGFHGTVVELRAAVRPGQHVRPRGSELTAGAIVLPAGTRVRAAAIGVLAVLGQSQVRVVARPRVAILATGDEVVPVDTAPLPHQVRESNSWALAAQVAECGGEALRLGVAPDEPVALRALLARGLQGVDVLVTIGGISKGTHDLVHDTLADLGVRTDFHGLDLKPGRPTYFGRADATAHRGGVLVFGLPGNPASSFTVFDLLVRPVLLALQGAAPPTTAVDLVAAGTPWLANSRLQAIPVRVRAEGDGRLAAELSSPSPSGDPFRLVDGDAYALIPGNVRWQPGATVRVVGGSGGVALP